MSNTEIIEGLNELKSQSRQLPEPVHFYCLHSAGYTLAVNHGKMVPIDGNFSRMGEKQAVFAPFGGSAYGHLATTDPEVALFLMNRVIHEQDIVTHETFLDVTTPPDVKIQIAMQREIVAKNTLAAFVEEQERNATNLAQELKEKDEELNKLKMKMQELEAAKAANAGARVQSVVAEAPTAPTPQKLK